VGDIEIERNETRLPRNKGVGNPAPHVKMYSIKNGGKE
jgi:hypothetical protein